MPSSQSGNAPEIVTAGLQCLLDITPTESVWAQPGLCLSFPPREGIPRPCSGAAALCFPENPQGSGWETQWECWRVALCTLLVVVAVSGMALKVLCAVLALLFPLRGGMSPKHPRFGILLLLCISKLGRNFLTRMQCCVEAGVQGVPISMSWLTQKLTHPPLSSCPP